jgi:hypothetical protein
MSPKLHERLLRQARSPANCPVSILSRQQQHTPTPNSRKPHDHTLQCIRVASTTILGKHGERLCIVTFMTNEEGVRKLELGFVAM